MSKALICGRDTGVPCIPLKLPARAGELICMKNMSKALICGRDTGVPCIPNVALAELRNKVSTKATRLRREKNF